MPKGKHKKQPFSCDLTARNDVNCIIDFSDFFIDSQIKKKHEWFSKGDILNVEFPKNATDIPRLKIIDGQDPSLSLEFDLSPIVPFECLCLSDFTQYITFSAAYDDTTWRVEIFRGRFPGRLRDKKDNKNCPVSFTMSLLNDSPIQSRNYNGRGGGYQPQ